MLFYAKFLMKIREIMSKLIGNAILSILTIVIFFFGYLSISILASSGLFVWITVLGFAIATYAVAVVKVARHFGIPLDDKLSEISPGFVAGLELVVPGIGFVYLGKQKQTNYTLIGLAIFSIYLVGALVFIFFFRKFISINFTEVYILVFRIVTPIVAYRTVKKLKTK